MADINETLAERGNSYGSFEERCKHEQRIKVAIASGSQWATMPDDCKCSLEMIATKISRIADGNNPNHFDSWHDIAGYATLIADRLTSPINP